MAFRALLFSKDPDTNNKMAAACQRAAIQAEACADIFTAIEKGKTQVFSCVIPDWADQPEAGFLLKRTRDSSPNRKTVAIAIVDHEPTSAEMREAQLDFVIFRPISPGEADAVLSKACEQMQPVSAEYAAEPPPLGDDDGSSTAPSADSPDADALEYSEPDLPVGPPEANAAEAGGDGQTATDEDEEDEEEPRRHRFAIGFRRPIAALLLLTALFYLWRSRESIVYLARTREGRVRVLRESVAALFYTDETGAMPVSSAGSDAQQDAYFSRNAGSNAETPTLGVVAPESTLAEGSTPLPKASDFPLPAPGFSAPVVPPIHVERAAIPESMRNSSPISSPLVVTVTPAQMMPVSASQPQPSVQQFSEPVALSEEAARALLLHTVDPVYPPEGLAQKLHGVVVLQALIGRDGSVEDLKIVRGYFILGRAAVAAVKQWRFQPYNLNGQAAATQTVITINFSYPPG
jgi:TonB family protein